MHSLTCNHTFSVVSINFDLILYSIFRLYFLKKERNYALLACLTDYILLS